jgi:hypothetical protein
MFVVGLGPIVAHCANLGFMVRLRPFGRATVSLGRRTTLFVGLAGLVACNSITGAGELEIASSTQQAADAGSGAADARADHVEETVPVEVDPPKTCPSAGWRCVPVAPDAWEGPVLVYEGTAESVPTCPTSMALTRLEANVGTPTGSHTCEDCSCGPATGITCSTTITQYNTSSCTDQLEPTMPLGATCLTTATNVDSVRIDMTPSGGSCAVQGGAPKLDPISWPSTIKACGAPSLLADGCAAGELCAPEAATPSKARHCIWKTGEDACPSAWPERVIAYAGVDDNRTCTGCGCTAPTRQCTGSVRYYSSSNQGCSGSSALSPIPTTCMVVKDRSGLVLVAADGSGSCGVSGQATPSGEVTGKDPSTLCCLPE